MDDKENIAEGLLVALLGSSPPKKTIGRKSRSKSIGPGGLEDAPLKESGGNRRKSAFIPAGILPSKEDEKKRREARRKSLANRRVSFAPEATLHTWNEIEYAAEATSSTASSGSTRRNSSITQASTAPSPPSSKSPTKKSPNGGPSPDASEKAQKKRRRSSGIPPMNFNNPEDAFSSSPVQVSSDDASDAEDDGEDTAMSMASLPGDVEQDDTAVSIGSPDVTNSSDRLEQALREAATHAGTRKLDYGDNGTATMELADDEITTSFKPWVTKASVEPKVMVEASPDSSVVARKNKAPVALGTDISVIEEVTEQDDMSMDITRAIGGIITSKPSELDDDDGGSLMDLTTAVGGIQQASVLPATGRRASLKRRRSSGATARSGVDATGSPEKKQTRQSVSRRQSTTEESMLGDETMDFTMAVGGIQLSKTQRDGDNLASEDATMDFTMVVGGIKGMPAIKAPVLGSESEAVDDNEELSMEMTTVLGGIKKSAAAPTTPEKPSGSDELASSKLELVPDSAKKTMSSPKKPSMSPSKPTSTPQRSPRRDTRRSLLSQDPSTPDAQKSPVKMRQTSSARSTRTLPVQETTKGETLSTPRPGSDRSGMEPDSSNNDSRATPQVKVSANEGQRDKEETDELHDEPTISTTAALHNSIKLLSTPRKLAQPSPMLRVTPKKAATPRKQQSPEKAATPAKKTPRKSLSPKKQVRMQEPSPEKVKPTNAAETATESSQVEGENIQLQDFLDMNNIRFMDLTTTKRRHTAAPSAFTNKRASRDLEEEDGQASLSSCVVAAACTLPEFEMYSHACSELKKYISGGKDVVRQIEADVSEENPPLFSEFLSAPPDQRYLIGNQLKNLKTFSRLKSKEGWYGWRSNLLQDLQTALMKTGDELDADAALLSKQEHLFESVLPDLIVRHEQLSSEKATLQQRADELTSCDKEELEAARTSLVDVESEIERKKEFLLQLQAELASKEEHIEAVKECKVEYAQEIKEAERVREACRGWSATEVQSLKGRVEALEAKYGWSITSAGYEPTPNLTMTLNSDLQLFFHPSAFSPNSRSDHNLPISLTYVGDSVTPHARPLTTTKRFFLQLLRAHLQCLQQSETTIPQLLATVKSVWRTATCVVAGVQSLEQACITEESILSDERMAACAMIILPSLKTKVRATFEVGVCIQGEDVQTDVSAKAEVVYGERYKETSMSNFLGTFAGTEVQEVEEMAKWGAGVKQLRGELIKKGPKNEPRV